MFIRKGNSKLLLAALLVSLLAFVCQATAQGASGETCSNATLSGSYAGFEQGTFVVSLEGLPVLPPFPYAVNGIVNYDGNGAASAHGWASLDGFPLEATYSGTYTVHPNCTLSGKFTNTVNGVTFGYEGTITGAGMQQEIHYVDTSNPSNPLTQAPFVAIGTMKRTPQGACSVSSLSGTYAIYGGGMITLTAGPSGPEPLTSPLLAAHSGIVTFDGAGSVSGSEASNQNGQTSSNTLTATYAVNPDCTVTATITSSTEGMPDVHEAGVITGEGNSREVHLIITDPGWVFVDTAKKQ